MHVEKNIYRYEQIGLYITQRDNEGSERPGSLSTIKPLTRHTLLLLRGRRRIRRVRLLLRGRERADPLHERHRAFLRVEGGFAATAAAAGRVATAGGRAIRMDDSVHGGTRLERWP